MEIAKTEDDVTLTTKELSIENKEDLKPSQNKLHLRLYGHPLCPYVERAKIALDSKGIKYQNVHVSLPDRPKWIYNYHTGAVPILEFQDGKFLAESLLIMELVDDLYHSEYFHPSDLSKLDHIPHRLYPKDPLKRAEYKMFLENFKDLGLYFFRATLTKKNDKRQKDLDSINLLLDILENALKDSATNFLFDEKAYGFVDVALVVQVERLFFMK